jgi:CRISPR-associated protein Cmr4
MKVTKFYKLRAITNLHPGSGDTNYGVVDNMVQRDPASDLPVIHGSSLKGAIKEHFSHDAKNNDLIVFVFGTNERNGNYHFTAAQIVAIPLRANKHPYYIATSPAVIQNFLQLAEAMNFQINQNLKDALEKFVRLNQDKPTVVNKNNLIIEDFEDFKEFKEFKEFNNNEITDEIRKFFNLQNDNLVLLPDAEFIKMTDKNNLPVIARNRLENGQSKNLWYEQVIPRESIFIMPIVIPENDNHYNDFNKGIIEKPVQLGGNASVGFGFTKFYNI